MTFLVTFFQSLCFHLSMLEMEHGKICQDYTPINVKPEVGGGGGGNRQPTGI